jgi:hypothetical protein
LKCCLVDREILLQVTSVNPASEALDFPTNVCFGIKEMPLVELLSLLLLFVLENDVPRERLRHQETLA